ncbi:hypothetical protein EKD16_04280 [Streptomonospora litoralis]|uniref:Uncharacterized protein n=1 Tax=Streptomonospora litoralis TaxID=2498135 RepID=A0A4P6Q1S2_9ACTN|nr:hypothetical protein EKD16_04280 [Streptomonospora litoralis]
MEWGVWGGAGPLGDLAGLPGVGWSSWGSGGGGGGGGGGGLRLRLSGRALAGGGGWRPAGRRVGSAVRPCWSAGCRAACTEKRRRGRRRAGPAVAGSGAGRWRARRRAALGRRGPVGASNARFSPDSGRCLVTTLRWAAPVPSSLSAGLDSAPNPALQTDSARLGPSIVNLWSQEGVFCGHKFAIIAGWTGIGDLPAPVRRLGTAVFRPGPHRPGDRAVRRGRGRPYARGCTGSGARGRRHVARGARARSPGVPSPDGVGF